MDTPREINIALAGNPNSGKSSVFNCLTGAHQKVANFPGVTVEKRTGQLRYNGFNITFTDLPGTYSLTAYSPDEKVARDFIMNERPDLIINVLDSGSLERGLYLTMQMIEMGVDVVIDLNMWDEAKETGIEVDTERLSQLLGAPVVKTIASRGQGIDSLLDAAVGLIEDRNNGHRHPPVSYGPRLDDVVADLSKDISHCADCQAICGARWMAVKLLEGDADVKKKFMAHHQESSQVVAKLESSMNHLKATTSGDPEVAVSEGRYGYVAGILREVVKRPPTDRMQMSVHIDNILTHRFWGYPIFLFLIWLIFQATFKLGAYPVNWINSGVELIQNFALSILPAGVASDLIGDGIIGGVGSVIVFLPNIVILFLGISLLEDSGYMARAAFLMDKLMHYLGLHGKSFIPLLMGFGCNVPAIMATRTLESRRDRILTILLIPMMSCSARLPVYILFAGAFFGASAGNVIFAIYLIGIVAAIMMARLFKRTILPSDNTPFVMELPPYRRPTGRSILIHMWERTKVYLRKMGGVILFASVLLWVLGYVPKKTHFSQDYNGQIAELSTIKSESAQTKIEELQNMRDAEALEYSFIGKLGHIVQPVVKPLGFNWQMGVSVLTGFFAKEVVVSTMGVLYHIGDNTQNLMTTLQDPDSGIGKLAAFAFMIFVLLYTPCVATIMAVKREIGTKWTWFSVVFQLGFAWLGAFVIFEGGKLLGI